MVHRITVEDAQAWLEETKGLLGSLNDDLCTQVETQVLSRIAVVYDVSTWVDTDTTPSLVKNVIAMYYVSWFYDRQYSENQDSGNNWAARLAQMADGIITSIISGSVVLTDSSQTNDSSAPAFYPTDDSSLMCPTRDDPSLGPAKFSMGQVW